MIEQALRKRLQPAVDRKRHVDLAWRLFVTWSLMGVVGLILWGVDWLWGWRTPVAGWVILTIVIVATVWVLRRSRRTQPDYGAIAREIEQHHPDLKALLMAAVEQQPKGPDGQWGYLQEWVVLQAISHAMSHNWAKSVSTRQLSLARLSGVVALVFLVAVLSQTGPFGLGRASHRGVLRDAAYNVTVTPGDTTVEQGSPVVIVARFEGRIPTEATLVFGPAGQSMQRMALTQNLGDPMFGGIIQAVQSDLIYRIEYAGQATQDYTIGTYANPSLTRADARIVYPLYTNLPEKVLLDTRQVSAVEGSQVTLTFTLNKPVTTARLVPREGPAIDLGPDPNTGATLGPNIYTTSITAAQTQRWELRLTDAQGRANKVPDRFVLEVQKNLAAAIQTVFPNQDVQVSPLEELALEAEVADDFGLIRYGLTYALAGTADTEVTLGGPAESKAKQKVQHLLALEDLKAQPDQLLTYSFWAEDAGPDGKTRRVASDIYFAEVRSFEEIFRESQSFQDPRSQEQRDQEQQGQGERPEQLIRLQKQIITATWNVKQKAEAAGGIPVTEDVNVVLDAQADALSKARSASSQAEDPASANGLEAAAGHMENSVKHLSQAKDSASTTELTPALGAEQAAYQELLRMRSREFQVGQGRNASQRNSANSARFEQQLEQLELRQQENRYETQRLARSQEQSAAREDLQVLNRLRDLAQRQSEMADRLREAEAALQQARSEQERQELQRQLQRLRDEQMEALRGVDQLQQRMERSENRQRMADARQQLTDSRSQIRQSAEEIEQGQVSRAATSTTRAQRGLEQMQDQFRRSTSSQFSDEVRQMRDQAQELDQRQGRIGDQIRQQVDAGRKTLRDSGDSNDLADQLDQQKERAQVLMDQMKEVSDKAEATEPLLSRALYDTLRKANTENLDRSLDVARELLRRNFLNQAQEIERQAGQGIQDLRKGVEAAARDVLGDETEALRLARQQLDDLIRQVNDEATRAGQTGQRPQGDANQPPRSAANEQGSSPQQGLGGDSGQQRQDGSPPDQAQAGERPASGTRTGRASTGVQADPAGAGGLDGVREDRDPNAPRGPLIGQDFMSWSDRLRDVEEMLSEQDLRNEAARVRGRARAIRAEFTRHGKEPQWDLVRDQITNPLTELRKRVAERLAQLQSDEALVQIDRDPVPSRFTESVRRYFENLGGSGQ